MKKKKIISEVNLTFLNHNLFKKVKKIIFKNRSQLLTFKITWNFLSHDLNNNIYSWKIDEKLGGGIKNIFLTHVFAYTDFFFGKLNKSNIKIKEINFKRLKYKNFISCDLKNKKNIRGQLCLFVKKKGLQEHIVEIKFKKFHLKLSTKSKDWTKNFRLKIYNKKNKLINIFKSDKKNKFLDGRSEQIFTMIENFIKKPSFTNHNYCLNAEKNINDI